MKRPEFTLEKITRLERLYNNSNGNICIEKMIAIVFDIPAAKNPSICSISQPLKLNTDLLRFRNAIQNIFNLTKLINSIQDNLLDIINEPTCIHELVDLLTKEYDINEKLKMEIEEVKDLQQTIWVK